METKSKARSPKGSTSIWKIDPKAVYMSDNEEFYRCT